MSIVNDTDVASILPSAMLVGNWQLYCLAIMYFITSLACVASIVIHCYHHRPLLRWFTFRLSFLFVASIFMMIRAILAFFKFPFTLFGLMLCSTFLPMLLQFTAFSLLILFLARRLMLFQGKQSLITKRLYPIYVVVLVIFWVGSILVNVFLAGGQGDYLRSSYDHRTSIYATLAFGFTVTCTFTAFLKAQTCKLKIQKCKVRRYMIIISIYLFAFMIRTIWSLLNFLYLNKLQELFYQFFSEGRGEAWTIYCVYFFLVEIAPVLAIVFILAAMTGPSAKSDIEKKPIMQAL